MKSQSHCFLKPALLAAAAAAALGAGLLAQQPAMPMPMPVAPHTASATPLAALVSQRKVSYAAASDFPAASGTVNLDKAANRITISSQTAALTVQTGPEENMMSFKIDGLFNPEIVLHRGARLTLTVVNVDDDMAHSFMLSRQGPPYAASPAMGAGMVMTPALAQHAAEKAPFTGLQLVLQANQSGQGFYVCAVRGHAKMGMFGRLSVQP